MCAQVQAMAHLRLRWHVCFDCIRVCCESDIREHELCFVFSLGALGILLLFYRSESGFSAFCTCEWYP